LRYIEKGKAMTVETENLMIEILKKNSGRHFWPEIRHGRLETSSQHD
jgi:hypothetical protein